MHGSVLQFPVENLEGYQNVRAETTATWNVADAPAKCTSGYHSVGARPAALQYQLTAWQPNREHLESKQQRLEPSRRWVQADLSLTNRCAAWATADLTSPCATTSRIIWRSRAAGSAG